MAKRTTRHLMAKEKRTTERKEKENLSKRKYEKYEKISLHIRGMSMILRFRQGTIQQLDRKLQKLNLFQRNTLIVF